MLTLRRHPERSEGSAVCPLSVNCAKHLQYLLRRKQMQILRCAQDDSVGDFFSSLFRDTPSCGAAAELERKSDMGDSNANQATSPSAINVCLGSVLAAFKNIKNRGNELKDLLQRQGITEMAASKRTHFRAEKGAIGAERSGISRAVRGRLAVPWLKRSGAIRGRASPTPTRMHEGDGRARNFVLARTIRECL